MSGLVLYGAKLESIPDAQPYLSWINGAGNRPGHVGINLKWALALCTDGVTWGRLDAGGWTMASARFPVLCPVVTSENLAELRLFGDESELLFWRTGTEFRGRVLVDADPPSEDFLAPIEERQVLLGNIIKKRDGGFTWVGNRAGREQVLPVSAADMASSEGSDRRGLENSGEGTHLRRSPFRLTVKHYLARDECSGVVRIAASRLKDVGVRR